MHQYENVRLWRTTMKSEHCSDLTSPVQHVLLNVHVQNPVHSPSYTTIGAIE